MAKKLNGGLRGGKTEAVKTEVLDALEQEVALVRDDTSILEKFTAGLTRFFDRARQLELTANANLQKAQMVKPPATLDDDVKVQFLIKNIGADKKDALEHWDITAKVWRLHGRLVAARKRSEEPNDKAIAILTKHHNAYVETEKRRAAEEQERKRREAEEKARQDRERELAELERQACAAEESSASLSEREQRFVELVSAGVVPSQAAYRAGYKDTTRGEQMMTWPKIQGALDAKKIAAVLREQKAAVAEKPLDVHVEKVQANISSAGGHDRTTHSAELLDERLLIEAILGGKHGIPTDILQVNPVKLNDYARSLRELINRWPGVRYSKKTSFV